MKLQGLTTKPNKMSETYEVEKIIEYRRRVNSDADTDNDNDDVLFAGSTEMLVKWKGYDNPEDNTWEDEDTLQLTARRSILSFWEECGGRNAALGLGGDGKTAGEIQFEVLQIVDGPKSVKIKTTTSKGEKQSEVTEVAIHRLYRVEWVGYKEMTWEPEENLPNHMVRDYEDGKKAKKGARKRKRRD